MRTTRKLLILLAPLALIAAACSSDDDDSSASATEAEDVESTDAGGDSGAAPAMSPASITAEDQSSDGSTIVVASITLPAPGFIAVHGDGDGAPGAVVGNSDLLPAGESTNVTVTLDEPLTESGVLFPMAHIDVNDNGVYEFAPPDETTDAPATTDSGDVAVVPAMVTVD